MLEPNAFAASSTRFFSESLTYVNASCAPSRCIASAIPHAIDRWLMMPVISARFPCRNPMMPPRLIVSANFSGQRAAASVRAGRKGCRRRDLGLGNGQAQTLSEMQRRRALQVVPAQQIVDPHMLVMRNAPQRFAGAHDMQRRSRLCRNGGNRAMCVDVYRRVATAGEQNLFAGGQNAIRRNVVDRGYCIDIEIVRCRENVDSFVLLQRDRMPLPPHRCRHER